MGEGGEIEGDYSYATTRGIAGKPVETLSQEGIPGPHSEHCEEKALFRFVKTAYTSHEF